MAIVQTPIPITHEIESYALLNVPSSDLSVIFRQRNDDGLRLVTCGKQACGDQKVVRRVSGDWSIAAGNRSIVLERILAAGDSYNLVSFRCTEDACAGSTARPLIPSTRLAPFAAADTEDALWVASEEEGQRLRIFRCTAKACTPVEADVSVRSEQIRIITAATGPTGDVWFAHNADGGAVQLTRCSGTACRPAGEVSVEDGRVELHRLAVGSSGAAIAFTHSNTGALSLARCRDGRCDQGQVHGIGSADAYAVAVNPSDHPVIVYRTGQDDRFRLVVCRDPLCATSSAVAH